ncbi:MAG: transglutaminase domain-containing protein [Phycisphaeraceae bacterium]|nr:transglutaminase domain-containing protein [Phycisphaeraceae bacterium]
MPDPADRRARRADLRVLRTLVLLLLCGLPTRAVAEGEAWRELHEHWYILEIAGAPAGYVHARVETSGSAYRSSTESRMRIGRGATSIGIVQRTVFIEQHDGTPVEVRFEQTMGRDRVDQVYRFGPESVEIRSNQGGRELTRTVPAPEPGWLPPMASVRFMEARIAEGATRAEYRTIAPETGFEPQVVRLRRTGEGERTVRGRAIPVTLWESSMSGLPGLVTMSAVSTDGHMIETAVDVPFGRVTTRLATELEARAAAEGVPPDLMVSTFIRPDRPIEHPRRTTRAVYRLRAKDGVLAEIVETAIQRVERVDDALHVTIDLSTRAAAPATDLENRAYLDPSSMVDSSDPAIVEAARTAAPDPAAPAAARAEAMRRFVYGHVSAKDLDTAFATASETVRTGSGDCSEHAVLLAALLRAQGIPSRTATGLVYADAFAGSRQIFGWHMWTQALIDGVWVDLDATLRDPMDATHVALGLTALDDASPIAGIASLIMLMGNLEIDVIEVEHAGPRR